MAEAIEAIRLRYCGIRIPVMATARLSFAASRSMAPMKLSGRLENNDLRGLPCAHFGIEQRGGPDNAHENQGPPITGRKTEHAHEHAVQHSIELIATGSAIGTHASTDPGRCDGRHGCRLR